ncbi:MAG TPA: hypothetical protein VGN90_18085, partial [Pyrinomonadaceae bacterium]|nr:hypothetical protein [Pyrinomonadaceae bacterium]
MTQVFIRFLAALVLLISCATAFAQTEQAAKQAALDQKIRAEVAQFKGKVSLFAKNLDTGAVYELGG